MRVKVGDPALIRRLQQYLAFDPTVIVTQIADDELEVSFIGSLNLTAQHMQTELRLRAWISAHPEAIVTVRE
jgi:hypothetical protein